MFKVRGSPAEHEFTHWVIRSMHLWEYMKLHVLLGGHQVTKGIKVYSRLKKNMINLFIDC